MTTRTLLLQVAFVLGCSPSTPDSTPMPTTEQLINDIDRLVVPTVRDESELDEVERQRDELVARLIARGLPAQQKVLSLLLERGRDSAIRQFWLPVLLRFEEGSPAPFVRQFQTLPIEAWELQILSEALPRYKEEWAYRWALRFVSSPEWAHRRDAVNALMQWARPRARDEVLDRLRLDEHEYVRLEAAAFGRHACFSGTEREVAALVAATQDRSPLVVIKAHTTLLQIVDASLDPPAMRVVKQQDSTLDPRVEWFGWWQKHGGKLTWDPSARRLVSRAK